MEVTTGPAFSREFHWSELWKRVAWRGVTAWKCPLDLWAYQQIVVETRPEAVIECGVAMGGSTLFLADVLGLCGGGHVWGVDLNLAWVDPAVRAHPGITLIEGNSVDPAVVERLSAETAGRRTMAILDSDHWVSHVFAELNTYAELVTPGCYLICEDGNLDRAQEPVLNGYAGPSAAVEAFLAAHPAFEPRDDRILGATFNPGGYLLRRPGRLEAK